MKRAVVFALILTAAAAIRLTTAYPQTQGSGEPEIIKHRINPHRPGSVPTGSTGTVTPPITYHGGPIIQVPVIYYIWYGNWNQGNGSDTPDGQQILRDFAGSIGGAPYFLINTTYSGVQGGVIFGGETTDNYSRGTRLRDRDIQTIVTSAISSGRLPYNTNGVYFVLTSSDVSELSGFCTKYCGWHTAGTASVGRIRYSFVGNANRCLNACAAQNIGPNGNAGVDAMVSIIAHELEEAATDPDLNAWYDSAGAENADKCAWTFGQTLLKAPNGAIYNVTLGSRNYLIQRNLKHDATGDTCNMDLTHQ